jgi:hypothetical protein
MDLFEQVSPDRKGNKNEKAIRFSILDTGGGMLVRSCSGL